MFEMNRTLKTKLLGYLNINREILNQHRKLDTRVFYVNSKNMSI